MYKSGEKNPIKDLKNTKYRHTYSFNVKISYQQKYANTLNLSYSKI